MPREKLCLRLTYRGEHDMNSIFPVANSRVKVRSRLADYGCALVVKFHSVDAWLVAVVLKFILFLKDCKKIIQIGPQITEIQPSKVGGSI